MSLQALPARHLPAPRGAPPGTQPPPDLSHRLAPSSQACALVLTLTLLRSACAHCLKFDQGPSGKNCSMLCKNVGQLSAPPEKGRRCKERDQDGCWITYTLRQRVGRDSYDIHVDDKRGGARGDPGPPPPARAPLPTQKAGLGVRQVSTAVVLPWPLSLAYVVSRERQCMACPRMTALF